MITAYVQLSHYSCFSFFRNLVRVTKSSQLQSVDPSQSNNTTYIGKMGKDFEFSHLNGRVDIAESSANTGDDDTPADIKTMQDWISKLQTLYCYLRHFSNFFLKQLYVSLTAMITLKTLIQNCGEDSLFIFVKVHLTT